MGDDLYRRMAADRDLLLRATCEHYGLPYTRPASLLRAVCGFLGFDVVASHLGLGQRGLFDFRRGIIYLNPAAYTAPSKYGGNRMAETLAHELGHIRLHEAQLRAGIRTDRQEEEAQAYSRIFLLPKQWFRSQAPVVAEDHIAAFKAAKAWGVSPGFVTVRAREVCAGATALAMPEEEVFRFR